MDPKPELAPELEELWDRLQRLYRACRDARWEKYRRLDPLAETLFDRNEKGLFLTGKNITVHDSSIVNGEVEIGEGTHVSQQTTLNGTGGLKIGRYCSVAAGARILTHDSAKWAVSGGKAKYTLAPVEIGDYCFIGANAVVTAGVSIGPHSVVGAGAVVTGDLPPYSIAVGVPARVVGKVVIDGDRVEFVMDARKE